MLEIKMISVGGNLTDISLSKKVTSFQNNKFKLSYKLSHR